MIIQHLIDLGVGSRVALAQGVFEGHFLELLHRVPCLHKEFLKGWFLFVVIGLIGQGVVNSFLSFCSPRMLEALDFAGRTLPLLAFGIVLNYFVSRGKMNLPWAAKASRR